MKNPRKKHKVFLKIVGLVRSGSYQKCRLFAERLHKHHQKTFLQPSITGLLDMDWTDYLGKLRKQLGGKTWAVRSVVVFLNDCVLGGEEELFQNFNNYFYKNPSEDKLKEHAEREYAGLLNKDNLIYTFMELSRNGEYMGTLLFQLRHDLLPDSCMWFTEFCTHERFSYRGTKIHRVCKNGWFQTGEMINQSEWSLSCLDDENYTYSHDRRGVLSFANDGKHSNKFQFFVTFQPAGWMDGKYVAFGRVVEGSEVLRKIENTPCTYECPDDEITITNCGLAKVGLGRALDPSLRLKGITVGQPHLHLEFFVEMLFERFDEVLFERLDEEVKRMLKEGKWISEILWDKVMEVLSKKRPGEDVLDPRDKSSEFYLPERYFAGLYSLPDIPDLYIRRLLDEAVRKAVDASGVNMIARSVVDLLVNLAFDEATLKEQVAEGIVQRLVKEVLRIVFGSEHTLEGTSSGVNNALSEVSILRPSLSDFKRRIGFSEEKPQMSTKESIFAFVWGMVLEMVQNLNGEGQFSESKL